jgi:hypothetical protein
VLRVITGPCLKERREGQQQPFLRDFPRQRGLREQLGISLCVTRIASLCPVQESNLPGICCLLAGSRGQATT